MSMCIVGVFFFFKQKTAYEMRISDWSSDVCSSDLGEISGWISGYRLVHDPEAMFVWQVAVHERARGRGLGVAMLNALFPFPAVFDAVRLVTTVPPSNPGSRNMLPHFSRLHGLDLEIRPFFHLTRPLSRPHTSA